MKYPKLYIAESIIGFLAFDDKNSLVDKSLFSEKPEKAVESFLKVESGKPTQEFDELISRLSKKCSLFAFENSQLADAANNLKVKAQVEKPNPSGEFLRSNMDQIAVQAGFSESLEKFFEFTRQASILTTRIKVKLKATKRDKIIIQAINAVDEIDKTLNLLAGRITEWFGLHFPELSKIIDSHETYAKLVKNLGVRDNFTVEQLQVQGVNAPKNEKIAYISGASIGAPMIEEDMHALQDLSELYLNISRMRNKLASKIDELMAEVSPNLSVVAGSTLGARLIAISGGLDRLARFPASTFQVLGAEKALFRALKTGGNPPKHGIIFQHSLIHQSPRWQRGKIARALAGKLAIAARIDAFRGENAGQKLREDLDKRIEEIKEKYKIPPTKQEKLGQKSKRKKR